MRSCCLLNLLFSIALLWSPHLSALCGTLKVTTNAEPRDLGGPLKLNAGETLPVLSMSDNRTKYNVSIGSRKVNVGPKNVLKLTKNNCDPQEAKVIEFGIKGFSDPSTARTEEGQPVDVDTIVKIISQITKSDGKVWFRTEFDGKILWLPQEAFSESTSSTKTKPSTTPQSFLKSLHYGVEIGILLNSPNTGYTSLKTVIPDASDVGPLQDPLITDISKGKGNALRIFAEHPFLEKYRGQVGLGYRDQIYSYTFNPNPTLGPAPLSSLSSAKKSFHLTQLQVDANAMRVHNVNDFNLSYGIQFNFLYMLSGKVDVATLVPSGILFKNTPSSVTVKPPQFDLEALLKGEVRWHSWDLYLGLTAGAAIHLGIGYVF